MSTSFCYHPARYQETAVRGNKKAADIKVDALRPKCFPVLPCHLEADASLLVRADQLFSRNGIGVKLVDHEMRFLKIGDSLLRNC